jgi:transposase-like protein
MERGGQSAACRGDGREIARREGVMASLLYRWRRELAGRQTLAFVPVRVAPEAIEEGPASTDACVPPSPSSLSSPSPQSSITIAFGERVWVTIEGAPDSETLAKVNGALMARDLLAGVALPAQSLNRGANRWRRLARR